MTMFLGSPVLTATAPLVSRDKGSIGNRVNCAGAQALNAVGTGAAIGGTIVAADYVVKNGAKIKEVAGQAAKKANPIVKAVTDFVSKNADKATNAVKNSGAYKTASKYVKGSSFFTGAKNFIKNALNKLNGSKILNVFGKAVNFAKKIAIKLGGMVNALPAPAKAVVMVVVGLLAANGIYRSGQIDQKYTDRAAMEKNFV